MLESYKWIGLMDGLDWISEGTFSMSTDSNNVKGLFSIMDDKRISVYLCVWGGGCGVCVCVCDRWFVVLHSRRTLRKNQII